MTEKGLKHWSNRKDSPYTEQYSVGVSPLSMSFTTSIFKQKQNIMNPVAINVQRISPTHEKLHFLHCSVRGVLHDLINVLGPFQSYWKLQTWKVCSLELPMLLVLVRHPGGGTQHIHIRGGKSDIFGSEYCEKWYFWVQRKLKLCSWYFLIPNIVELIFLGSLQVMLFSICIVSRHFMFIYWFLSIKWGDIFGLQWSWNDIFGLPENFLDWPPRMRICWVPPWGKTGAKSKNISIFRLFSGIWLIQICEVLLMVWNFKNGNCFSGSPSRLRWFKSHNFALTHLVQIIKLGVHLKYYIFFCRNSWIQIRKSIESCRASISLKEDDNRGAAAIWKSHLKDTEETFAALTTSLLDARSIYRH